MNCSCHVAVEAGESTFVFANFLPIHPEPRPVICCAYMQKYLCMFLGFVSEVAFVPNWTLIVEERFALRVPVGGNLQFWRNGEVIFDWRRITRFRFLIEKPSIRLLLMMKAEQP